MPTRDLDVLEREFKQAAVRRPRHTDKMSRIGNMLTIDHILDEGLVLMKNFNKKEQDA